MTKHKNWQVTEYAPLGPLERAELIDSLKEMVEIYQDEDCPLGKQPACIQRAIAALRHANIIA